MVSNLSDVSLSSSDSLSEDEKERIAMQESINRPRGNRLQWGGFGKKKDKDKEAV